MRNLVRNCHPCSVAHFGGAMAKQTWKERMEDKQDGAIKALVALHDRIARQEKEATERHEAIMEGHRAFMARLNGGKDQS